MISPPERTARIARRLLDAGAFAAEMVLVPLRFAFRAVAALVVPALAGLGLVALLGLIAWHEGAVDPAVDLAWALPRVEAAAGVTLAYGMLMGLVSLVLRNPAPQRTRRLSRTECRVTARHEAGHALCALVLGLPFRHARVLRRADEFGRFGFVEMTGLSQTPANPDALWSLLIRSAAMLLAGVAAERPWPDTAAALPRLAGQVDWHQAIHTCWLANWGMPDNSIASVLMTELIGIFRASAWRAAIDETATLLLRHPEGVPAGRIAPIVQAHNLQLRGIARLAHAAPRPEEAGPSDQPSLPSGEPAA